MKALFTLTLLAGLATTAHAQQVEEVTPQSYPLTQRAPAYKKADTLSVSLTIPADEEVLVVSKQGEALSVIKRGGFLYYMPNRFIRGLGVVPISAQEDANRTEEYCLILASQKFLSTQVTIYVDFGQRRRMFSDQRRRDETGKVQSFNSSIDALNYMNSQGWLFVNAYTITVGNQNVYHYLMRRPVVHGTK